MKCYNQMILLKVNKSKHVQISLLYLVVNSFLPNVLILYPPLPKNLYKNCTKWIPKLYKTLNLYIFCIQRLYKSKLCMIKKYTPNSYIYTKKKKKKYKLYKTSTKFRPKTASNLKCLFFVQTDCTNCTKPIQLK